MAFGRLGLGNGLGPVGAGASSGGPGPIRGYYNFTGANLTAWQSAYAGNDARILCFGDSTVVGSGSGSGGGLIGAKANSWPTKLASLFGVKGNTASFMGDQNVTVSGVTPAQYDPRFSGSVWSASGVNSIGAQMFNKGTPGLITHEFTPTEPFDTIVILYPTTSGLGSLDVSVDAGSSLGTINNAGADGYHSAVFHCALGTHTLKLASTTPPCYVDGVILFNSASPQVSVINGGWGSATSSILSNTGAQWDPGNAIALSTQHLLLAQGGIVNDMSGGASVAQSAINIGNIIDKAKLSGSVVPVTNAPIDPGTVSYDTQRQYIDAWKAVALAKNAPIIDMFELFGDGSGTYQAALMTDNKHPNAAGYISIASKIYPALQGGFLAI